MVVDDDGTDLQDDVAAQRDLATIIPPTGRKLLYDLMGSVRR
jgi:hypothetical protein